MKKAEVLALLKDARLAQFNEKYFDGKLYSGGHYEFGWRQQYCEALGSRMVAEYPYAKFEIFEKEMLKRIEAARKLEGEMPSSFYHFAGQNGQHTTRPTDFVYNFFEHSVGLSFREQMDAFRLNVAVARKWTRKRDLLPFEFQREQFQLRYRLAIHPESFLSLGIYHRNELVASIGGFIYRRRGKTRMRINHIQGTPTRFPNLGSTIEILNSRLGMSWRHFLLGKAVDYAKSMRLSVEGTGPASFEIGLIGTLKQSEQERLERMYAQTYRKSGLKQTKTEGLWRK